MPVTLAEAVTAYGAAHYASEGESECGCEEADPDGPYTWTAVRQALVAYRAAGGPETPTPGHP